jgi:hypothetical protein
MGWTRVAIYPASFWTRSASVSHRSAISRKTIYVRKCRLPPLIECIRQRYCVTDRSWASPLPCLLCTTLAMSKFGARESRASRGPPGYPCVALSMRGTRAAQRGHAPDAGVLTALASERLYFKCYCACRRHQGCHCRETETSVRLRFLGSSRASHCLPVSGHMGCGSQSAMAGRKLNAGHLLGVLP